jgi:hypothetical protein
VQESLARGVRQLALRSQSIVLGDLAGTGLRRYLVTPAKAGAYHCDVGVDGPLRHRMCQAVMVDNAAKRSRPNDDYQNWSGYVQTCVSDSWG